MEHTGFNKQLDDQVVDSMFADLGDVTLLLPMSAIAEVVLDVNVTDPAEGLDWLHGWIAWRNIKLPLVAFEQLVGSEKMALGEEPKVLVLNTLGKGKGTDFYAILLNELPQPARIAEHDEIKTLRNAEANDYVRMKVELDERQAIIPDLESLERFVRASTVA